MGLTLLDQDPEQIALGVGALGFSMKCHRRLSDQSLVPPLGLCSSSWPAFSDRSQGKRLGAHGEAGGQLSS